VAKQNSNAKVNIPMCLACVLLCLTLVSIHLTSGLYAKYTVSGSGSDNARVITFGDITLTETGDFVDGKLIITPGVDLTKKAVVSFSGSESATYVFIEVTPSPEWKTDDKYTFYVGSQAQPDLTWSVKSTWAFVTYDSVKNRYIYSQSLVPNEALSDDIIAGDTIAVHPSITKTEITAFTNVYINLRASVVQSGGFTNTQDAWNSLAAKE
jgi:hypothetical protein